MNASSASMSGKSALNTFKLRPSASGSSLSQANGAQGLDAATNSSADPAASGGMSDTPRSSRLSRQSVSGDVQVCHRPAATHVSA